MNRRHEWRQRKQRPLRFGRGHRIRCPIFGHGADRDRFRKKWSRESDRLADESRLPNLRVCQGLLPGVRLASASGPQRRPFQRWAARRPNRPLGELHGFFFPCFVILPNCLPHRSSAARTVRNLGIDGDGIICHTVRAFDRNSIPVLVTECDFLGRCCCIGLLSVITVDRIINY